MSSFDAFGDGSEYTLKKSKLYQLMGAVGCVGLMIGIVLGGAVIAIIMATYDWGCDGDTGTPEEKEAYEFTEDMAVAVDAFASGSNTDVCWSHGEDNAPALYAIMEDALGNAIPWEVEVEGSKVCYVMQTISRNSAFIGGYGVFEEQESSGYVSDSYLPESSGDWYSVPGFFGNTGDTE